MNLQEEIKRMQKLMGILLENESSNIYYHGNRKGDFPPKNRRYAGAIFLTSSLNFAKNFADKEEFPNGKVWEVKLKDGLKISDPTNPNDMKELDLKRTIQDMIDVNYVDPVNGTKFNKVSNKDFIGYDYETDNEFNIKDDSDSVYFYLWRIKNGAWRIIETEPIISKIKDSGYDGFKVNEMGETNVGIFSENSIDSFKEIS